MNVKLIRENSSGLKGSGGWVASNTNNSSNNTKKTATPQKQSKSSNNNSGNQPAAPQNAVVSPQNVKQKEGITSARNWIVEV